MSSGQTLPTLNQSTQLARSSQHVSRSLAASPQFAPAHKIELAPTFLMCALPQENDVVLHDSRSTQQRLSSPSSQMVDPQ
jgi:hypothetical protein